jgi:hypothetical protein
MGALLAAGASAPQIALDTSRYSGNDRVEHLA